MARLPGGFQRRPDTQVMFAVHYEDGRTAYIRVGPETARHGNMIIMDVARERQNAGEIPSGKIASVKQVRYQPVDQVLVSSGRWSKSILKTIRAGVAL